MMLYRTRIITGRHSVWMTVVSQVEHGCTKSSDLLNFDPCCTDLLLTAVYTEWMENKLCF